jgi:CheY-like chemotaxis protein
VSKPVLLQQTALQRPDVIEVLRAMGIYVMATILLAEDYADAAEPLAVALRRAGYHVLQVPDGRAALGLIVEQRVDLIITDLRMPRMDGATLLAIAQPYLHRESIPVIVYSAYAEGQVEEHLRTLGISEVLIKGRTGLKGLLEAVERYLPSPDVATRGNLSARAAKAAG